VRLIQQTGTLDGTHKQALIETLRSYADASRPPKP